jgi:hypothetical protein
MKQGTEEERHPYSCINELDDRGVLHQPLSFAYKVLVSAYEDNRANHHVCPCIIACLVHTMVKCISKRLASMDRMEAAH